MGPGNISHVETFDQFGETIHFGTLIKLVGLPSFTHLSITIVNIPVCIVNVISIPSSNGYAVLACLLWHNMLDSLFSITIHSSDNY